MNNKLLVTLLVGIFSALIGNSQKTEVYTATGTWTVPAHVYSVTIKAYGGAGGTGGQDCGNGCTNAAAGNAGYVIASFTVVSGNTIGIYPGGKGANGANNITGAGAGAGGTATYGNYGGGAGGNAGASGSSGAGGGGGAATVVTINSVVKLVAGGAAGGGGMGNVANSGLAGNNTTAANGTSNAGGTGTTPSGDGGGGGGGGGGQYGSLGGAVHAAGGESAGDGGRIGTNQITGASSITTNSNVAWTSGGRIEISYNITLPVNWLGFSANLQSDNSVRLNWSTAAEIDSKEFIIQRSTNGIDWSAIGTVAAIGNSVNAHGYTFTDKNANSTVIYYKLEEVDMDSQTNYSNTIVVRNGGGISMQLFPNPVKNGVATLFLKNEANVTIFNSTGMKMMERQYQAGSNTLNVSTMPKGLYFLKAGVDCIRFVIQ